MINIFITINHIMTTQQFWDSVATCYSDNQMTHTENDQELQTILKHIQNIQIETILSIGVADGCRDPTFILEYLKTQNKPMPKEIGYNDISHDMMKIAASKINKYRLNTVAYAGPIQDYLPIIKHKNMMICIGVYNLNYFDKAMDMYSKEKQIIGTEIQLNPIIFSNTLQYVEDHSFTFTQDRTTEWASQIIQWEQIPNFMGIRFQTNTGFLSHYYDSKQLHKILLTLNPNTICEKPNGRYIIYIISNPEAKGVITMINNVLGNIETKDQYSVLTKLSKFL